MSSRKHGLGRNLRELLESNVSQKEEPVVTRDAHGQSLQSIPLDAIEPGPFQPRKHFDHDTIAELAKSIKSQGVLQPIVVRTQREGRFEIVSGERRWRAAMQAGLKQIPAIVRELDDTTTMTLALIENIQREDLGALEVARALSRLQQHEQLETHQEIADAVGKSRTTVTNLLRLLQLAPEVQTMLEHGDIDMGHARALLTQPEDKQITLARLIVARGMTVREVERMIQSKEANNETDSEDLPSVDYKPWQTRFAQALKTPVAIKAKATGKGKIVIAFNNEQELEDIFDRLA